MIGKEDEEDDVGGSTRWTTSDELEFLLMLAAGGNWPALENYQRTISFRRWGPEINVAEVGRIAEKLISMGKAGIGATYAQEKLKEIGNLASNLTAAHLRQPLRVRSTRRLR